MFLFFLLSSILISFLAVKIIKTIINKRNQKLLSFKNKLLSKESQIEKIFSRQDEKTSLDPNINIKIDIRENQENIIRKANIHRARLAKFKKSKLNGELIFLDSDSNIYKLVDGKKVFIN